jgi:hypothetical protein
MKTSSLLVSCAAFLLLSTLDSQLSIVRAQGTAFTYQGRLDDGSSPATGTYDLRFAIYDAVTNGTLIAGPLATTAAAVSNGLFSVKLDFGAGAFTGSDRWLEISVRTNGGTGLTTLSPRQMLTSTPYALYSRTAGIAGTASGVTPGSITGASIAPGQVIKSLNGFSDTVTLLSGANMAITPSGNNLLLSVAPTWWNLGGNNGTSPTNGNFLGTRDNQPLELWVNNARALRLEPGVSGNGAPNLIGGSMVNFAAGGTVGATIGGGGATNFFDLSSGTNTSYVNSVSGNFGTVAGGAQNIVAGPYSSIGGGLYNAVQSNSFYTTIGGGAYNTIGSNSPSVTISGGYSHSVKDNAADATIGGGSYNSIGTNAAYATVAGGRFNSIGGNTSAGTIGGGFANGVQANAVYSTIGGGSFNSSSGQYSTVPGGAQNTASGNYSLAAGQRAKANHDGALVWADSQSADFASTAADQFLIRAGNGVGINTNNPAGAALNVAGTIRATAFQGNGAGLTNVGVPTSGNYLFSYDTTMQPVISAGTFQDITFTTDAVTNGWTHTAGSATFANSRSGLFLIQYSSEAGSSGGGTSTASIHAVLNGVEIPGSQASTDLTTSFQTLCISKSFVASINALDVLKLQFAGSAFNDRLVAGNNWGSFQPSVSLTIIRIQ